MMTRTTARPTGSIIARVAVILVGLIGLGVVTSPGALAEPTRTVINPGLDATGGAIAGDGPAGGQALDSRQAATFMQALLATAIYGSPSFSEPPSGAARYTVTVDTVFHGPDVTANDPQAAAPDIPNTITVNYATDGTNAWVSLPQEALWPGAYIGPDQANKWFVASPAIVKAFEGTGTLREFPAESTATTTATGSSDSDPVLPSALVTVLVVLGAAIVVGGITVVVRRRNSTTEA